MNKKGIKTIVGVTFMSLILTTALSAGPVKAAAGRVTRISGMDRYATASQVATVNWPDGSDNVVLVSGEGYADAVSASALAKKLDAPILLTTPDTLSTDAQTALTTLKPKNIYIIGGTASISQNIRDDLKTKCNFIVELGGTDRYETNAKVAGELVTLGTDPGNVIVVGGDGFSDALSVAPVASAKGQILLLANNDETSTQPVIDFININKSKVTVVGTSNVINDTIYNALGATARVDGGSTRFDTNLKVLNAFKDSFKTDKLYIASASPADPDNLYADALVASAVAGKYSAPLVLVDKDPSVSTTSPNATDNAIAYIKGNTTFNTDFQLIGGTGVVSQATEDAIEPEVMAEKPNIYLYPEKTEELSVNVTPKGKITKSIPEYNGEWKVTVDPDGRIDNTYDFLFYEASLNYQFTLDKGWIINKDNFSEEMNNILTSIGLNSKEKTDFMEYWSKRLTWPSSRYAVYYLDSEEINEAIKLNISEKPDSILRAYFYFVPLNDNENLEIKKPKIDEFKRNGFTVVEWGGICPQL